LEQQKKELQENLKQRFEDKILKIKSTWQKRKDQNLENQEKLKNGHENKKLVIKFSNKKLDNYKFRTSELIKRYKMKKLKIPPLTPIQQEIFRILNVKTEDMMKV